VVDEEVHFHYNNSAEVEEGVEFLALEEQTYCAPAFYGL
jgi:hypothetical protein